MAIIPKNDEIYHKLNSTEIVLFPRPYLGLSMIGHNCHRYLQYYHYWAFKTVISKRVERLFNFGHMMEPHMTADLAEIGIHVVDAQTEMIGSGGHWKGHCDGVAFSEANIDQKFLTEYKTHNDKNFKNLVKNGVHKAFPKHVHQANSYMGYLELPYTFYLGYNKDDSKYHYETFNFSMEMFKEDKRKEVEVITSDTLLPRIGNGTPAWHECKMCEARQVCFKRKAPTITCRSCAYVDILPEGKWKCTLPEALAEQDSLSTEDQEKACDYYLIGDMFR